MFNMLKLKIKSAKNNHLVQSQMVLVKLELVKMQSDNLKNIQLQLILVYQTIQWTYLRTSTSFLTNIYH